MRHKKEPFVSRDSLHSYEKPADSDFFQAGQMNFYYSLRQLLDSHRIARYGHVANHLIPSNWQSKDTGPLISQMPASFCSNIRPFFAKNMHVHHNIRRIVSQYVNWSIENECKKISRTLLNSGDACLPLNNRRNFRFKAAS
jgi:hypothetical protein